MSRTFPLDTRVRPGRSDAMSADIEAKLERTSQELDRSPAEPQTGVRAADIRSSPRQALSAAPSSGRVRAFTQTRLCPQYKAVRALRGRLSLCTFGPKLHRLTCQLSPSQYTLHLVCIQRLAKRTCLFPMTRGNPGGPENISFYHITISRLSSSPSC